MPVLIEEIFTLYYLLFLSVVRSSLFALLFWLQIFPIVDLCPWSLKYRSLPIYFIEFISYFFIVSLIIVYFLFGVCVYPSITVYLK